MTQSQSQKLTSKPIGVYRALILLRMNGKTSSHTHLVLSLVRSWGDSVKTQLWRRRCESTVELMNAAELQNPLIISTPRTAGLARGGGGLEMVSNARHEGSTCIFCCYSWTCACVSCVTFHQLSGPGPYVAKRNTVTSICTRVMRLGTLSYVLALLQGLRNQEGLISNNPTTLTVKTVTAFTFSNRYLKFLKEILIYTRIYNQGIPVINSLKEW